MPARGSSKRDQDQDLKGWSNYGTCKWIDIPDPSPTGPRRDSPELIPDSEPSSSATASGEEARSSEEDLASVPSTVQVGSPRSSDAERTASPIKSPGGTWINPDGSRSLRNFYYDDDVETPREAPPDYSLPSISELRRTAASYSGREERAGEPHAHFNTGDYISRNKERRRKRPTSLDAPPPSGQIPGEHLEARGRTLTPKEPLSGAGRQPSQEAKAAPPLKRSLRTRVA